MPKLEKGLTERMAEALLPEPSETIWWDPKLTGFGLRISPKGKKVFICQYRYRQADGSLKERQEKIGELAYLSVAEARKRAQQIKARVSDGVDPVAEKKADQAKARAEQRAKDFTFAKLVERYETESGDLSPKTLRASSANELKRLLKRWNTALGTRPVKDVSKSDITKFLRSIYANKADTGGIEANNLLRSVDRLFKWAIKQEFITTNPATDIDKPQKRIKERDHYLENDEIKRFWQACEAIGWPTGRLFQLLLLTGQRESEVGGMRWTELDLDKKVWNLPPKRTKNGKAHTVHLSDLAMEIINNIPRISNNPFLFSLNGIKPMTNYDYPKNRITKLMGADTQPWRPHDLRRTATTLMAELGVPHHVCDKILNHTAGQIRGVARVYNRYEYLDERKAALNSLSRFIETLIGRDTAGNVVPIRA